MSIPVDMPTHMALQMCLEPLAYEIVRFLFLVHAVAYQSLHGQGFPMFWKLFEDLIGGLDALFILLGFVKLDNLPKQGRFLAW